MGLHLHCYQSHRGLIRAAQKRSSLNAFLAIGLVYALTSPTYAGDILRGGVTRANDAARAQALANTGQAQALKLRANAQDRLARTTQALQSMQAAQAAARSAAASVNNVANGMVPGGLEVLTGPNAKWQGADAALAVGNDVNIKQNDPQAVLHWKTFNVGRDTTVNFDQSKGGADAGKWIAFNKVFDPSAAPSQIRGRINAQGQVYIINQNGIAFSGSSQINTRALVASSLPINDNLIQRGLLNQQAKAPEFLFSGLRADNFDRDVDVDGDGLIEAGKDYIAYSRTADIKVEVEQGARLSAPVSAEGFGGRVMLVGQTVINRGAISTEAGQTVLAAGLQVAVSEHSSADPTLRGLDVAIGKVADVAAGLEGGKVRNEGLITVPRGSVLLAGSDIRHSGMIDSSTSVDLNGRIDFLADFGATANNNYEPANPNFGPAFVPTASGFVEFSAGSVTRVLPEWSSSKTLAASALPLRSTVNARAGNVYFGPGSVVQAPSGDVDVRAGSWALQGSGQPYLESGQPKFLQSGGQIFVGASALIDVSGSTDVFVPLHHQIMTLQMRGAELADSPLQRDAGLRAVSLVMDMRQSGSYYGRPWVGTPLGDLTGYLNLIERNAGQLTLEGGTVALQAGGSVVLDRSAVVDAAGGYSRNEGGQIQTTRLQLGPTFLDISRATPDRIYDGIFTGRSTSSSEKWGVTRTHALPLAPLGGYEQGEYLAGANAGRIVISAPAMALDGTMSAARVIGPQQMRDSASSSSLPQSGSLALRFVAQDNDADNAANKFGLISPTPPTIIFRPGTSVAESLAFRLSAGGVADDLPLARLETVVLSDELLDEDKFGSIEIENSDGDIVVSAGSVLRAPVEGSVTLSAANILIDGSILAPGGAINLTAYTFSPYQAAFLNQTAGDSLPLPDPSRGLVRMGSRSTVSAAGHIFDDRRSSSDAYTRPIAAKGGDIRMESYSIDVASGSRLDVSGGAIFTAQGEVSFGDAGHLSLLAGRDPNLTGITGGQLNFQPASLAGYSAAHGGTLSLQAGRFVLGRVEREDGVVGLGAEFFQRGGFSRYELTGIGALAAGAGDFLPGILVASGAKIEPRTTSLLATAQVQAPRGSGQLRPTDGLLVAESYSPVGPALLSSYVLNEGLRDPAQISLRAIGATDNLSNLPLIRGDVRMEAGSQISVDAVSEVTLSGKTVTVHGQISAPSGHISIEGAETFPVLTKGPHALATVHLGSSAVLEARGKTVLSPDFLSAQRGSVLPGGLIEIAGNIVAERGSVINVTGASGTLDFTLPELGLQGMRAAPDSMLLAQRPYALQVVRRQVDSGGGKIVLRGSEMLAVDSTLLGHGGGPAALGGFLSVASGRYVPPRTASRTSDINLSVRQSGLVVGAGELGVGMALTDSTGAPLLETDIAGKTYSGQGYFAADRFNSGGFSALELGGNVRFAGDVDISAPLVVWVAHGGVIEASGKVRISAPHVALGRGFLEPRSPDQEVPKYFSETDANGNLLGNAYRPEPLGGTGSLSVSAGLIDLGTLVTQGLGLTSLNAERGDIRGNGIVSTVGDLRLTAGQIYPTTAGTLDVFVYNNKTTGETGSLQISSAGAGLRPLPFSAGGSLRLFASDILQEGSLRAPFGKITLGWDGSVAAAPVNDVVGSVLSVPVTSTLTLAAGSETTVSGRGLLLPYGMSPDGLRWLDPSGFDISLGGLPEKSITLGAGNLVTAPGSLIDLSGGGDLYAYRWAQGPGGFEDILADQNSFAVLPGYGLSYAPSVPFNRSSTSLLGDPGYVSEVLGVGDQITLQGSGALAAGTYTLMPARYALLPGAVLVTPLEALPVPASDPASSFLDSTPGSIALEDGAFLVSGRLGNVYTAGRGTPVQASTYRILSGAAVRDRSGYQDFRANDFLAAAAAARGQQPQRLPVDAGDVSFLASTRASLAGGLASLPGTGGRGSRADLAIAGALSLVDRGATGIPGTSVLDTALLSSWGVESLLVGGQRTGESLAVRSSAITLDNRGGNLSGPDIILAATREIRLEDNARISAPNAAYSGAGSLSLTGDGSVVRVSADSNAGLSRTGSSGDPSVSLALGAGTLLQGRSVTLDSTSATLLDPAALLLADSLALNTGRVSVLLDNPGVLGAEPGLVLDAAGLSGLSGSLNLLSYSSIDLYGTGVLPLGSDGRLALRTAGLRGFNQAGGSVVVQAGELLLDNTPGGSLPVDSQSADGTLHLDVGSLVLGQGEVGIRQFADIILDAPGGVHFEGSGRLSLGGNMGGTVSALTAAAAVQHGIHAEGDLLLGAVGSTLYSPGLAADISLMGRSIMIDADILLPSGKVALTSSEGDISVGGAVDLAGRAVSFYDTERFAGGGIFTAMAAGGDVALNGSVDVSAAAAGGNAGSVSLAAPDGAVLVPGVLLGAGGSGGSSGAFSADARSYAPGQIDALNTLLTGGSFDQSRRFRARTGDIALATDVTSRNFAAFADEGSIDLTSLIDASGETGGAIHLAAHGDLTVRSGAKLTVRADDFNSAGKGGSILLESGTSRSGVAGAGTLTLADGSELDLGVATYVPYVPGSSNQAGSSAFYGQFQGTLHLRAPQTAGGTDLLVNPLAGTITGASSILVEGFRTTDLKAAGGSIVNAATQSAVMANGVLFGSNIGDKDTVGSMTARLLGTANKTLADVLVLAPGAEIMNTAGSLRLAADWNLATSRFGPKSAPGVLSLRAAGDLVFEGALSDGFAGGSSLWHSPLMEQNSKLPMNTQSWSYRLVAGADSGAADSLAVGSGGASVKIGKDYGNASFDTGSSANTASIVPTRYQAIRTGSGRIDVAASDDIQLLNQFATIYTAGTALAAQNSIYSPGDFELPHLVPDAGPTSVSDNYVLGNQQQITKAVYSAAGGDINLNAGGDIARLTRNSSSLVDDSSRQLPMNWLYRRGYVDPATGEYGRSGVKFLSSGSRYVDDPASSTTWWVDFSNFFQGIGTLGGGNISLSAAGDVRNVDVVAPTTARAPRGRADAGNLLETGGGDISVQAGRDISGGVYYVERGAGVLQAGRDVTSNETRSISLGVVGTGNLNRPSTSDPDSWLPTTFFVGRGGFEVTAGRDLLAGPVANAFLLPQGIGNRYWYRTYFSTYGADSYLRATALAGNLNMRTESALANGTAFSPMLGLWMNQHNVFDRFATTSESSSFHQPWLRLSESSLSAFDSVFRVMAPRLELSALGGEMALQGSVTLFPSATGGAELVSAGTISGLEGVNTTKSGGPVKMLWSASTINVSDADPRSLPSVSTPFAYFSTIGLDATQTPRRDLPTAQSFASSGTDFLSFIAATFAETGAYTGSAGFAPKKQSLHAPGILHAGDPTPLRLYSGRGDITGLTLFSPKVTQIAAGRDITDVAFYVQNTAAADISWVSAGRDIISHDPNSPRRLLAAANGGFFRVGERPLAGDLQISGPGSFQILAGRDLDLGPGQPYGPDLGLGITSIGNARNPYLPFVGADLYVGAGLGASAGLAASSLRYDQFLDEYLAQYGGELGVDSATVAAFTPGQKAELAVRLLSVILRASGREAASTGSYEKGFAALQALAGGSGSGNVAVKTRDIRTKSGGRIHVLAPGGEVRLAEDGGSQAADRPQLANLAGTGSFYLTGNSSGATAAPAGIVTEYGGDVGVATRGDVSIGNGRIFTLRGGDIVIWSSEGDIAAGSAAKTVAAAPPTRVLIDPQSASIETDLSGLATGGGIGVLSTVAGVTPGDVDLIAPNGTVDAGDAGIRASGNLNIAAAQVLNADNISVSGTSAGVPASAPPAAPNVAGLSSASSSSAATSNAAQDVTRQAESQQAEAEQLPSTVTVEVLGYGGGERGREEDDREARLGSASGDVVL